MTHSLCDAPIVDIIVKGLSAPKQYVQNEDSDMTQGNAKLKIGICDDEAGSRQLITTYLYEINPKMMWSSFHPERSCLLLRILAH